MMDEARARFEDEDIARGIHARAPVSILARGTRIRLVESDRLEHFPLAGEIVRRREGQASVPTGDLGSGSMGDDFRGLTQCAAASESHSRRGVCSSMERRG